MKFARPTRFRSQLPIVPLIDILLILLMFFVVATKFKAPRSVLHIEMPTVNDVPSGNVKDTRSVLSVDAQGRMALDSLNVPDGLLESYLQAFRKQNPERKLELQADKNLPLEKLLGVWDALTKAGIEIKDVPARIRLNGQPTS